VNFVSICNLKILFVLGVFCSKYCKKFLSQPKLLKLKAIHRTLKQTERQQKPGQAELPRLLRVQQLPGVKKKLPQKRTELPLLEKKLLLTRLQLS